MKPGSQLDVLVAEKVMGLKVCQCAEPEEHPYKDAPCLRCKLPIADEYSEDIAAAWEVVRHMNMKRDWLFSVRQRRSGAWRAMFFTPDVDGPYFKSICETMPHAICLAALKAVDGNP